MPGNRTRPRGLSLVEVLVAAALLGLILLLLFQVLIPGLKLWRHTRAIAELEQQVMISQDKMMTSLMSTTAESISTLQDSDLRAFSSLTHKGSGLQPGYDPLTGRTVWREAAIFMLRPSNGELQWLAWRGSPSVPPHSLPTHTPFAFTPSQLRTLCGAGLERRVLCEGTTQLQLSNPTDGQWRLEIEASRALSSGPHTVRRVLQVHPRIRGDFT